MNCKSCIYYQPNDFSNASLHYKIFGVCGFCLDNENKDFNEFAKNFGRGLSRKDIKDIPIWCRFKESFVNEYQKKMKYFIEWLKSFELSFKINPHKFSINLLILSFYIGVESCTFVYCLSLRFPKYAFILTRGHNFFYQNRLYWFYKKRFNKFIKFYILHVLGDNATQIEGKKKTNGLDNFK